MWLLSYRTRKYASVTASTQLLLPACLPGFMHTRTHAHTLRCKFIMITVVLHMILACMFYAYHTKQEGLGASWVQAGRGGCHVLLPDLNDCHQTSHKIHNCGNKFNTCSTRLSQGGDPGGTQKRLNEDAHTMACMMCMQWPAGPLIAACLPPCLHARRCGPGPSSGSWMPTARSC